MIAKLFNASVWEWALRLLPLPLFTTVVILAKHGRTEWAGIVALTSAAIVISYGPMCFIWSYMDREREKARGT